MRLPAPFSTLETELSTPFAQVLTAGQRRALAAWVAGTVVAGSACQTMVTAALVEALAVGSWHTVRQTLREFVYDGAERSAPGRVQVEPAACCAPLRRWVLSLGHGPQVALALDVTTHTDQLTAIVVSLLTHGRAIPVAWHLLAGNQPGAFIAPALRLLTALAPALVGPLQVSLAADRGLWSPPLADQVTALGWQPLLRVQRDVSIWLGRGQRVRADRLVAGPGHAWVGRVTVHKDRARWPRPDGGGRVGGGPCRAVGDLHHPASGGRRPAVVRAAGVDCGGLPRPQAVGLAVGTDAAPSPPAGRPPLAGAGRGHRLGPRPRHPARPRRSRSGTPAPGGAAAPATTQRLPAWSLPPAGPAARPSPAPHPRPHACPLARPCPPPASPHRRTRHPTPPPHRPRTHGQPTPVSQYWGRGNQCGATVPKP